MTDLTQPEAQALEVLAAARKFEDRALHELTVRLKGFADARQAAGAEEEAWFVFNLAVLLGCVGAERVLTLRGMEAQLEPDASPPGPGEG